MSKNELCSEAQAIVSQVAKWLEAKPKDTGTGEILDPEARRLKTELDTVIVILARIKQTEEDD